MKHSNNQLKQIILNSRVAMSLTLSLATALAPSMALALNVQVNHTVNLRTEDSSGLKKVGQLAAGSIVSIPDEFAIRKNGAVDFELTLNNWLTKASSMANAPGLKIFDSSKKDFYFPIKIVKAANGSTGANQNSSFMVALSYLQRKGALLETTGDTPLLAKATDSSNANAPDVSATQNGSNDLAQAAADTSANTNSAVGAPVAAANNLEGSAVCVECERQAQTGSQPLNADAQWLASALNQNLARPLDKMRKRTANDVAATASNFERTCGISLNSFVPVLQREINNSDLHALAPHALNATMMLSLMTQESGGRCTSTHREAGGVSVGLFQVNTHGSTGALMNPVNNARAALTKLDAKYAALSKDFDFSKMSEEDRLRLVISAYNGGEGWVSQAKNDLLDFNRRQGTNLNYNNWENLRIFYFRHFLNRNYEYQMFGTVDRSQRKVSNTLLNLSYTENIVPRPQAPVYGARVQDQWNERLS